MTAFDTQSTNNHGDLIQSDGVSKPFDITEFTFKTGRCAAGAKLGAPEVSPMASGHDHLPIMELHKYSESADELSKTANDMEFALRKNFSSRESPSNVKFFINYQDNRSTASAWDMGQVMQATIAIGLLSNKPDTKEFEQVLSCLDHYWDKTSNPPGYYAGYHPFDQRNIHDDKYYDDNHWIGLGLVDAYKQNPDPKYLERAKQVFDFDEYGTRGTDKLTCPGGVLWTQQEGNLYRATVSTAGAAQLAMELYGQTQDPTEKDRYLQFAIKEFGWVNENLRAPNGLYWDGMDSNGSIHKQEYTYNQGLMLGNATMLYQATGDKRFLQTAQEIARDSVKAFAEGTTNSDIPTAFSKQLTFFNAVFFKNLMTLDSVAPDPSYRKALADYSSQVLQEVDPKTHVMKVDGKSTLLDQASAIQIIQLTQKYPPA